MADAEEIPKQNEINLEINALREKIANTQDLYQAVCALLFFRYGVTPTANKLYQLVRKGSMSAPAEALRAFWENLREKSRVRIEHPDLPVELAHAAGEMIGTLWQRAQSQATASYEASQRESQAAVSEANRQAQAAEARAESAAQALFALQAEFSANLTRLQELERALAREAGINGELRRRAATLADERQAALQDLEQVRRQAEQERLEQSEAANRLKARQEEGMRSLREEMAAAQERALAQQGALQAAQESLASQGAHHAVERARMQQEVSRLEQELGVALGSLGEARAAREAFRIQLDKSLVRSKRSVQVRRGRITHRP